MNAFTRCLIRGRYQCCAVAFGLVASLFPADKVGRETGAPYHLADDQEFRLPLRELLRYGKQLFAANWTDQEGGGRPLAKGTGLILSDPSQALTGARAFNRLSGPDANSCFGCHNTPYAGGGGDFATSVFVLGQRFDFLTFDPADKLPTKGIVAENGNRVSLHDAANLRSTTGLFGAGYLEMLARQITADLQRIRDTIGAGETKDLMSKGIRFGKLTRRMDGTWDTSKVDGLPHLSLLSAGSYEIPSLVIRPWHQASHAVSLREFTNNAYHQHHGIQTTERFGTNTDPDGDSFTNELTRADVTAVTIYQASLPVPGRVISNDPDIQQAVLEGERQFSRIGCSTCHIPSLPLEKKGWIYTEPNPFNPPGTLRISQVEVMRVDLSNPVLPAPRLRPSRDGVLHVPAFTDFKLHEICTENEGEPLDMNRGAWSPKFTKGNRRFLTKRLWGAASEPPFFHHGLFTTLRAAILAHSGEALASRRAFERLDGYRRDSVVEFLKTLRVLPPGTEDLVVDENGKKKTWPPRLSR